MYHRLLNSLFSFTVKSERCYASCLANKYVSSNGVQNFLNKKIGEAEDKRLAVFEGKLKEELTNDNLIKGRARIESALKSGQIDTGNYYTQLYKLNEIEKTRKMKDHNQSYYGNNNDLKEDILRKHAQFGNELDKSYYNQHQATKLKNDGLLGWFWRKSSKPTNSDKMLL